MEKTFLISWRKNEASDMDRKIHFIKRHFDTAEEAQKTLDRFARLFRNKETLVAPDIRRYDVLDPEYLGIVGTVIYRGLDITPTKRGWHFIGRGQNANSRVPHDTPEGASRNMGELRAI